MHELEHAQAQEVEDPKNSGIFPPAGRVDITQALCKTSILLKKNIQNRPLSLILKTFSILFSGKLWKRTKRKKK